MDGWITRIIEGGGYAGIALLMALENIFPPVPSEVIMGVAGVAVAEGRMSFWPLLFWGTLGSTLGNYCWFLLGDRLGYQRMEPFIRKRGRWITVRWSQVEYAAAFFRKWGEWVVFVVRFLPFMRTMISLPAGLAHMKHWRFLAFTFAGSAIWNALWILGGGMAARLMGEVEHYLAPAVLILLAIAAIWYVFRVVTWQEEDAPDAPND